MGEPFGGEVHFTDGTSTTYSTRERPQVIFAEGDTTTPVGFVGGVSSQPVGPQCNSCKRGTCSQCKITEGRDWTYTVLQPLKGRRTLRNQVEHSTPWSRRCAFESVFF